MLKCPIFSLVFCVCVLLPMKMHNSLVCCHLICAGTKSVAEIGRNATRIKQNKAKKWPKKKCEEKEWPWKLKWALKIRAFVIIVDFRVCIPNSCSTQCSPDGRIKVWRRFVWPEWQTVMAEQRIQRIIYKWNRFSAFVNSPVKEEVVFSDRALNAGARRADTGMRTTE